MNLTSFFTKWLSKQSWSKCLKSCRVDDQSQKLDKIETASQRLYWGLDRSIVVFERKFFVNLFIINEEIAAKGPYVRTHTKCQGLIYQSKKNEWIVFKTDSSDRNCMYYTTFKSKHWVHCNTAWGSLCICHCYNDLMLLLFMLKLCFWQVLDYYLVCT